MEKALSEKWTIRKKKLGKLDAQWVMRKKKRFFIIWSTLKVVSCNDLYYYNK